ncbi:DUF547 domain-containing protein [Vibrio sp. SS-MA-C1-2]|uniref:DUF547 domain-containing protein n=1 Tax=Vibrio sp. SS-MA-C1-2 TaxID=2908646 RepID=UPI001F171488|nr:DUF547 domain-containing protein [Vibrio sp. SS-MA-C1-2]UJF17950.1 DUF547 domain-containing protein [Vibrio sp. SS-MA-C1-2]
MKYFFAVLLTLLSFQSFAAQKSELWAFWDHSDPTNATIISHQSYQDLLDTYLHQQGEYTLFDYHAVTKTDNKKLNNYLKSLQEQDPRQLNRQEQYAYWVNLYNATTVKVILDNYPVKSITKIGGFFSFGPWDEEQLTVEGKKLTLNDIEHRILRPIWQDPRTHYAVNCASLGCPNLQNKVFTANNSEALLDKAAAEFINSKKGVLEKEDEIQLSSIYEWFSVDFGSQQQLFKHLKQYKPTIKPFPKNIEYEYDWNLNDIK